MASREQILTALGRIRHPEKGKDIVSLGMIGGITTGDEGISLVITPERSNDPFLSSLKSAISKTLKESFGPDTVIHEIRIEPKITVGKKEKPIQEEQPVLPGVMNIVAISSGKGGVGKTTIAVNLAVSLAKKGLAVGLIDADIFGPSVPKMFREEDYRPEVIRENGTDYIIPMIKYGVKVLSAGFFVDPNDAVIWRGPMASGFLKQLIMQGKWGELDYLLVDLPPGTSDIHLTLVQEVPVTGAVVVTTPQDVALADAVKGIAMFRSDRIDVPVLGLVENMSWFTPAELPLNRYYIFGRDGGKKLAEKMNVPLLGQIPLVQGIREGSDSGEPVALAGSVSGLAFDQLAGELIARVEQRNRDLMPTMKVKVSKQ